VTPGKANGKKDDQPEQRKVLPFMEIAGDLYLTVQSGDLFHFVHLENGNIVEDEKINDLIPIYPCTLPIHHDTGERVPIVGVPDGFMVKTVPVVEPVALYEMMRAHIERYADLPELELQIGIYYALYSWFYLKVPTSPYLRYIADTGKGKSRLLDVVSDLCFYPIRATGASSASGIMRFHEKWKGTLVIDEGDLKGGAEDPLIKFLNTGFEKGKYLILSDKNDPNQQQIFDPYGPKVLAMREPFKDNATEGRCISFSPYETTRRNIPPELPKEYHDEVKKIRAIIARFVLHHWGSVSGGEMIRDDDIDVERRLLQMSRPVSIILQLFPDGKERYLSYIRQRQKEIRKTRAESWEGSIFNHALMMARGEIEDSPGRTPEAITPKALAEAFKSTPKTITRTLISIGFEIEHSNITEQDREGNKRRRTVRKLVVPNERTWQEIVRRYYSPDDERQEQLDTLTGIPCPDILMGRKYSFLPAQSVTHVTHVTLQEHSPPQSVTLVTVTPCTPQNFINNSSCTGEPSERGEGGLCTVSVTPVTTVTKSYAGKTREQLTEIMIQYGGREKIPDPERFKEAWGAAGN